MISRIWSDAMNSRTVSLLKWRYINAKLTHGRPSEHLPLIASDEFAFITLESDMYTPYLLAKDVFVPYAAV
jgi:hypothetical protein